jgi:hypothetical protein
VEEKIFWVGMWSEHSLDLERKGMAALFFECV